MTNGEHDPDAPAPEGPQVGQYRTAPKVDAEDGSAIAGEIEQHQPRTAPKTDMEDGTPPAHAGQAQTAPKADDDADGAALADVGQPVTGPTID